MIIAAACKFRVVRDVARARCYRIGAGVVYFAYSARPVYIAGICRGVKIDNCVDIRAATLEIDTAARHCRVFNYGAVLHHTVCQYKNSSAVRRVVISHQAALQKTAVIADYSTACAF